jgi:hypothetical protein
MTVAVKVTDWLKADGLGELVTTVVVAVETALTVCVGSPADFPPTFPSPK